MASIRHLVVVLVFASVALLAGGCDKHAADKRQIHSVWQDYKQGNIQHLGDQVARLMSQKTCEYYGGLVKKGMDLPAKQVLELPPTQMSEILIMRCRAKRAELKNLDGRGYIAFATGKGWYEDDDEDWKLTNIHVSEEGKATASVYNPAWETEYNKDQTFRALSRRSRRMSVAVDKPYRYSVELVKEGSEWKLDETSMFDFRDKELRRIAHEFKMSVRDMLMLVEADHAGDDKLPMSVWEPMKK